MKTDIDAILDVLEKAQARIEELQTTVIQQQAMINAVLLCLRDRTQSDPKELEKLFSVLPEGHSPGTCENQQKTPNLSAPWP